MARVICTLPNASTNINGVAFIEDRGQMISEDIPDHIADNFASIPGYELVGAKKAAAATNAAGDASDEATAPQAGAGEASTGAKRGRPRKDAASAEAPTAVRTEAPVEDAPAAETGSETTPAVADGFGDPE